MPCLIGCIALAFPRLGLFLVWFFGGDYLFRAYHGWLLPLIGFFFLPLTTLAFAFGVNSLGRPGEMPPLGWLLTVIALFIDVGLIGGSGRSARRYRKQRERD